MNDKTKENIKEVQEAIKKVAEKKPYKVGDEYILDTEVYKVVEILSIS